MGTLTRSLFADMDFLGNNIGGVSFCFLTVAYVILKILQNIASAVSKLRGWVGLGETPSFNTLPASGDCSHFVCHMPTAADPRIP